ncbi:hypothetical protein FISHEDRAFT_56589 [Fistulina hepatica ATCC 64428]|uniref:Uncharacterized protein n=1 Tax=Fistulina hepatica ATCC 64428 TaxID=1128425 RepID=A0A0D7AIN1_9AGAR|nr:hypothetical protein FISHEDRAFT_56589 [Fistulina hepatica ATCC 64428]
MPFVQDNIVETIHVPAGIGGEGGELSRDERGGQCAETCSLRNGPSETQDERIDGGKGKRPARIAERMRQHKLCRPLLSGATHEAVEPKFQQNMRSSAASHRKARSAMRAWSAILQPPQTQPVKRTPNGGVVLIVT